MLTVNGPTTYYDYHSHGMGLQYLLCEKFAQQIGVSLRVEECKDTAEMVRKLEKGEGDVIAVPYPENRPEATCCSVVLRPTVPEPNGLCRTVTRVLPTP